MMGSPFPGMDPYLEGEMWMEFHDRLINQISEQLMLRVAPKYVALFHKRHVLDRSLLGILTDPRERILYPDVHVSLPSETRDMAAVYTPSRSALASVELTSPVPELVPMLSIEIRDVAERQLVTVIEILSPVNKHGEDWRDYQTRRIEIMQTQTHLVEIDLLRAGKRIQLIGELPRAPYFAFVSRYQKRPKTQVWGIGLREPLPELPIPLLPPDPDATLDLQAAVDACFRIVPYDRLLDYTQPPPPPSLNAGDAQWVQEKIRAAGFMK